MVDIHQLSSIELQQLLEDHPWFTVARREALSRQGDDEEALRRTHECGEMVFWSRSRKEYWHKGDTSGNVMTVVDWAADCDSDALLFKVRMQGPQVACHTGARSCFFKKCEK